MKETPKEVLEEYGINAVIERFVENDEAMTIISEYVFTLINKVTTLQNQNKQMKSFIENNELNMLKEFKDYFPKGL
jgi:hypothetical protein